MEFGRLCACNRACFFDGFVRVLQQGARSVEEHPARIGQPNWLGRAFEQRKSNFVFNSGFAGLLLAGIHAASTRRERRFPSQPPPRNSASASIPRTRSSMPLSYAETRNIVFLKSAVLGRSLLIEKKGKEYEQNNQSHWTSYDPQVDNSASPARTWASRSETRRRMATARTGNVIRTHAKKIALGLRAFAINQTRNS